MKMQSGAATIRVSANRRRKVVERVVEAAVVLGGHPVEGRERREHHMTSPGGAWSARDRCPGRRSGPSRALPRLARHLGERGASMAMTGMATAPHRMRTSSPRGLDRVRRIHMVASTRTRAMLFSPKFVAEGGQVGFPSGRRPARYGASFGMGARSVARRGVDAPPKSMTRAPVRKDARGNPM